MSLDMIGFVSYSIPTKIIKNILNDHSEITELYQIFKSKKKKIFNGFRHL